MPSYAEDLQVFYCPGEALKQNLPSVCFLRFDSIAFGESQSEDEQFEHDLELDPPNWQQLVSREVLLGLKPSEIKRQEVINGKFNHLLLAIYTETSRMKRIS